MVIEVLRGILWLFLLGIILSLTRPLFAKIPFGTFVNVAVVILLGVVFFQYLLKILLIQSFFHFIFTPLGIFFLILLIGNSQKKDDKVRRKFFSIALLWLWLNSTPLIAYTTASYLEKEAFKGQTEWLKYCNCNLMGEKLGSIVLLGHNTTHPQLDPSLSHNPIIQTTDTGNTIRLSTYLYHRQKKINNQVLIIIDTTKDQFYKSDSPTFNEAENIKKMLRQNGVPDKQIVILYPENNGKGNFHESALKVKDLLEKDKKYQPLRNQPIALVSSALESNRAYLTFSHEKLKLRVIPFPTNFYTIQKEEDYKKNREECLKKKQKQEAEKKKEKIECKPEVTMNIYKNPVNLIPSVSALSLNTRVVNEFFMTFYYFLINWLSFKS